MILEATSVEPKYLGNIPEGWKSLKFSHIFEFIKTTSFSRAKLIDQPTGKGINYIHYGDIHTKFKFKVIDVSNSDFPFLKDEFVAESKFSFLQDGDLVIADASEDYEGVAECIELVNVGKSKIIGGLHTMVARDKKGLTNPGFRAYLFKHQGVSRELKMMASGLSVYGISKGNLSNIFLALPPLPEQKKIATILSTVQDAREKTEAAIQAAKALKRSMMKHLFTYGPVPISEAEKVELRETEIGSVPKSWGIKKLEELFEFSRKPRNLRISSDRDICFIPMDLIPEEGLNVKWHQRKSSDIRSGTYVERGDLIIGKITPCFENGKQAILNNLPESFAYATTEVWAIHPNEKRELESRVLFEYLKQSNVRFELASKMEGATGRQRLPRHILQNLVLPMPSVEEQIQMIKIFESLDQKISSEITRKEALDTLFQSLLDQLMTGKLRVADLDIP